MMLKEPSDIARFLAKIPKRCADECWEWNGVPDACGYGTMRVGSVRPKAHRLAFSFFNKCHIPSGMVVRHICDNPPCVNPDHLLLGTQGDNVQDRQTRGRAAKHHGSLNGRAVIPEDEIPLVRKRHAAGERQSDIALDYGVTRQAVWRVVRNKTWQHLLMESGK